MGLTLIYCNSYEGLPPNYSVGANMVAGAFAGIAVSVLAAPASVKDCLADSTIGAYGHVPRRFLEGKIFTVPYPERIY